ncbi:MAG: glycosyltransferase, partial [Bdellovibrionota bacterium]|nr:glycosyltransferase [Bdellovibrionota bacterium]
MKTCFLIPSYQHSKSIQKILEDLAYFKLPCVVVNDGSDEFHTNNLREICSRFSFVDLVEHEVNQGKGGAVITGLKRAFELENTHAIQVDSDGQHDLEKIKDLLAESQKHPYAVISGKPVYDESVPTGRKVGRYITHFWVWVETLSFEIKDSMCGFRVYPLKESVALFDRVDIGKRMDFDIEVLVRLFWQGLEIRYVDVKVEYPEEGVSHFRMLEDNVLISKMHTKLFFGMLWRLPNLILRKFVSRKTKDHWARSDEKGMVVGILFLFWVYRIFGRKVLNFFLSFVVFYYQFFARKARLSSKDFIRRYQNYCQENQLEAQKLSVFKHIYSFADSILDKLAVWQGLYDRSVIHQDDLNAFDALKEQKNGAVFISAHFGNIEMARALGRNNGSKDFVALVYNENAVKFNSSLSGINPESSLNMISVAGFNPAIAVDLRDRVDRGEWIFIMGDRRSVSEAGNLNQADLLGEEADFTEGPYLLSYLLACPVYSFFCYKENQKYRIHCKEITPKVERDRAHRREFIQTLTKNYASELNDVILQEPSQWFNFFK